MQEAGLIRDEPITTVERNRQHHEKLTEAEVSGELCRAVKNSVSFVKEKCCYCGQ